MTSTKGRKGKVTVMANEIPATKNMNADKAGYYSSVDVWPAFPGGQSAMDHFFETNIEYPATAADNGTQGVVRISFDVDEKGKILSPKILSAPIGDGIDEEALRVFNKMPAWTPGKVKGKEVKTHVVLPVRFQLSS